MVLSRAENKILESGLKTSSKFRTWNVYAIVPLISRDHLVDLTIIYRTVSNCHREQGNLVIGSGVTNNWFIGWHQ